MKASLISHPLIANVCLSALVTLGTSHSLAIDHVIYVAPSVPAGQTEDGTLGNPFDTLAEAKTLAVQKCNEPGSTSVTIYLRGGEYPMLAPIANPSQPVVNFKSADFIAGHAPLAIKAYPGEQPALHGSVTFVPTGATTADVGYWAQVNNLSVYDGGTTASFDANPNNPMKLVSIWKFVFTGAKKTELANRIAGLRSANINGGAFSLTELYVDETRKTRSRHPNVRAFTADTSPFTGDTLSQQQNAVIVNPKWIGPNQTYRNQILDGKTELVFTRQFQEPRVPITDASVLSDGRIFLHLSSLRNDLVNGVREFPYEAGEGGLGLGEVKGTVFLPAGRDQWNQGRMENNLKFVDTPGEWFFEVGGEPHQDEMALYYYPQSGETTDSYNGKTFYLPFTYTLIGLNWVPPTDLSAQPLLTDISLDGIEMKYTAWKYENGRGNSEFHSFVQACYGLSGVIDGNNLKNVSIKNCKIRDFGLNGIALGGNRRAFFGIKSDHDYYAHHRSWTQNVTIEANQIYNGGGGAIRIDHYPYLTSRGDEDIPSLTALYDHNQILSNDVHHTGRVFASSVAIIVGKGFNTLVMGNTVRHVPYTGIHVNAGCWRSKEERLKVWNNTVEYAMRRLVDGGGIYTFGGFKINIVNNNPRFNGQIRDDDAMAVPPTMITPQGNIAWKDIYLDWMSYLFNVSGNNLAGDGYTPKIGVRNDYHTISGSGNIIYLEHLTYQEITGKCPSRDEDCCGH